MDWGFRYPPPPPQHWINMDIMRETCTQAIETAIIDIYYNIRGHRDLIDEP